MKILIEESVLRQALEALTNRDPYVAKELSNDAITALRTALDAAEKVEPVIWKIDAPDAFWFQEGPDDSENDDITSTPLYTLEQIK